MRPRRRAIMPCATRWQTRMVESRLRSSTARTSTSGTPTASFGSGLPPAAAMSPPALCTRMSIGPSSASTSATTRATCAPSVRSPSVRQTGTPCASAIARAVAVSVVPSPYSAGPCSRMPCTPTGAAERRETLGERAPEPAPRPGDQRYPTLQHACVLGHDESPPAVPPDHGTSALDRKPGGSRTRGRGSGFRSTASASVPTGAGQIG